MNTLDTLAFTVAPIDSTESVSGGILPIIGMFVAGFGLGFGGAALYDLATGG